MTDNPVWKGDISDFIVNGAVMLQLDAAQAGSSFIYTKTTAPDSIEWEIYFKMDFSPSASNRLRIYLMYDQEALANARGYYIDVGESGSNDGMLFYKFAGTQTSLLAAATMGALAGPVAECRLKVTRSEEGLWIFNADYSGGRFFQMEFEIFDNEWTFSEFYFALECHYTGSRTNQFFFDDLLIREITPDLIPPILVSSQPRQPDEILLIFDENLDPLSAGVESNYSVEPDIGNPSSAILDPGGNEVILTLNESLQSGQIYTLRYQNVLDLAGNSGSGEENLFLIENPVPGDLVINEILFNPYSGGSDFVEILNLSGKFISLDQLSIGNAENDQEEEVRGVLYMNPGSFLALTEDTLHIMNNYNVINSSALIQNDLPAFNNDNGNVRIITDDGTFRMTVDSFDYSEDMHFVLLDDVEGVSLERINPSAPTNDSGNWQSASSFVRYGTPGYQNSNFIEQPGSIGSRFSLRKKLFSPNDDGQDDQLVLDYALERGGYVLNLNIYDVNGVMVRQLVNNEQLPANGFILWDGLDKENRIADVGVYLLWIQIFDPEGRTHSEKISCILADYLDR